MTEDHNPWKDQKCPSPQATESARAPRMPQSAMREARCSFWRVTPWSSAAKNCQLPSPFRPLSLFPTQANIVCSEEGKLGRTLGSFLFPVVFTLLPQLLSERTNALWERLRSNSLAVCSVCGLVSLGESGYLWLTEDTCDLGTRSFFHLQLQRHVFSGVLNKTSQFSLSVNGSFTEWKCTRTFWKLYVL